METVFQIGKEKDKKMNKMLKSQAINRGSKSKLGIYFDPTPYSSSALVTSTQGKSTVSCSE